MMKKLLLSTALSAALAGAAFAQSTSTPSSTDASPAAKSDSAKMESSGKTNFVAAQKSDQWLASKFKGTDVLGSDNQKIGDVSDILFDKSGKVDAVIVGVGGFLGIGSKDVALPLSSFQVVPGSNGAPDKLRLSMTKDQLKEMAEFKPASSSKMTTGAAPTTPAANKMSPPPASNK